MAGVMLVILGVTGMGAAVNYIPRPVVIGFTNGIAVLIASTQIKDFLGLRIDDVPARSSPACRRSRVTCDTITPVGGAARLHRARRSSWCCAGGCPRVPGTIVALVGGTALVMVLGSTSRRSGRGSAGFPPACHARSSRSSTCRCIPPLLRPALTVAMLGAIESLMSAVVADRMGGDRHNPNVELVAQGIANIVSPLFGGLPATGAIARTATNIRSGARTPVAGMIHALTLLVVLVVAAPLARYIPLAVLGAILLVVAYNMGEWREIPRLLKLTKTDISVWLVTFFADGVRRPDGGGRGRHDPRGAALHPPGRGHDDRLAGDAGLHRGRARPHPAGQDDSAVRDRLPDPRTVPVRRDRQDRRTSPITSTDSRRSSSCGCAT